MPVQLKRICGVSASMTAMHLPFIERLQSRLKEPLPGREAQFKMASVRRLQELGYHPAPPVDAKIACVMLLLYFEADRRHTVLIQRTENPNDRHSGQISFPGGRYEEGDGTLEKVALRETEEEIGVPSEQIQVIGRLTELWIPVSNFLVHPFIGVAQGKPEFRPQAGEVAHIYTPSVDHFLSPESRVKRSLTLSSGITLDDVPCYQVEGKTVWGATAMILSEFTHLWEEI